MTGVCKTGWRLLIPALAVGALVLTGPTRGRAQEDNGGPQLDLSGEESQKGRDEKRDRVYYDRKDRGHGDTGTQLGNLAANTQVGGYFESGFYTRGRGTSRSNFDQHRFIIAVSSAVTENIFFNSEVEFEGGGDASETDGVNIRGGGGEIVIEQAFIDWRLHDAFVFRVGAVLVPMGRLNVLHDAPLLDFTERPLADRVIVPSTWTEAAVGFTGVVYPDDDMAVNYELYVGQGLRDDGIGIPSEITPAQFALLTADLDEDAFTIGNALNSDNGTRDARAGFRDDNNDDKSVFGRVGFSPQVGTEVGVAVYTANIDDKDERRLWMYGADLRTRWRDFELEAEGYWVTINDSGLAGPDELAALGLDPSEFDLPERMWGWTVEGHYHFAPEFVRTALDGQLRNSTFTAVARVGQVDPNTEIRDSNDITRYEFGVNFRPIEAFVLKTEYQINEERRDPKGTGSNQFIASAALAF